MPNTAACSNYLVPSARSECGVTSAVDCNSKQRCLSLSTPGELRRLCFQPEQDRASRASGDRAVDNTRCGMTTPFDGSSLAGCLCCFFHPSVRPRSALASRRRQSFLGRQPFVGRTLCSGSSAGIGATTRGIPTASTNSSSPGAAAPSPALWPRTAKLVEGILAGSRTSLSRAITLGERSFSADVSLGEHAHCHLSRSCRHLV